MSVSQAYGKVFLLIGVELPTNKCFSGYDGHLQFGVDAPLLASSYGRVLAEPSHPRHRRAP